MKKMPEEVQVALKKTTLTRKKFQLTKISNNQQLLKVVKLKRDKGTVPSDGKTKNYSNKAMQLNHISNLCQNSEVLIFLEVEGKWPWKWTSQWLMLRFNMYEVVSEGHNKKSTTIQWQVKSPHITILNLNYKSPLVYCSF